MPPGSEYRFQARQLIKDRVVGGSVYVVRLAGEARPSIGDGENEEVKVEEKLRHMPLWIEVKMRERARRFGIVP